MDLVEYALYSLEKLSTSDQKNVDKVVVVFDKDDEPWEMIEKAFKLAKINDIEVCFSNECFEIWLLAHFEEILKNKNWTRELLFDRLSQLLGVKSYDEEKANKILIQKIFANVDATECNSVNFSTNRKMTSYCDMKLIIQKIFETSF